MDKVVVRNISSDDTGSLIVSSTNCQGDYDSYCIASSSIGLKESAVEDMIDRRVKELLPEVLSSH